MEKVSSAFWTAVILVGILIAALLVSRNKYKKTVSVFQNDYKKAVSLKKSKLSTTPEVKSNESDRQAIKRDFNDLDAVVEELNTKESNTPPL